MKRYAAIDIGTNTILLLIAERTSEGLLQTVVDLETATRLGEGLMNTGEISPLAMQKSVDVIHSYLSLCRDEGVREVVAAGTSTLREASNRSDFLETVRRQCGLEIEVISGHEEARLSHLAVARDRKWPPGPLVVIDIEGGSTEWIYGETDGGGRVFTMNIGSMRLTEQFLASDPVNEGEYVAMVSHVRRLLEALPPLGAHALLVGIGGTIATLFSVKEGLREFQPSRIHHGLLELKDIEEQIQQFKSLPLKQRRAIAGLPLERADVIMAGATILLHSVLRLGSNRIWVSCHGHRYGVLVDRFFKETPLWLD